MASGISFSFGRMVYSSSSRLLFLPLSIARTLRVFPGGLRDSGVAGLNSLYGLYSNILKARGVPKGAKFRRVIGVLLTAAPYHSMCEAERARG